jgi:hypothetical protein
MKRLKNDDPDLQDLLDDIRDEVDYDGHDSAVREIVEDERDTHYEEIEDNNFNNDISIFDEEEDDYDS